MTTHRIITSENYNPLDGWHWVAQREGYILGEDMAGSGKTEQAAIADLLALEAEVEG